MASTSVVTKRFAPDRKLINAKFEGYKLSPFPEQESLFRTPLPCPRLVVEKAAQLNHLGFRDLQARVRFSHLAQGFPLNEHVGTAYYIDQEESKVVMVLFDKETNQTSFQDIAKLEIESGTVPSYAEPDPTVPINRHYPSIIAVTPTILVVSDGSGSIQVLQQDVGAKDTVSTSVLANLSYEGDGMEGISPVPCTLLAGRLVGDAIVLVMYSNVASTSTKFNICTMELTLQPPALKLLYMQRGNQVPVYVSIDDDYAIFGSETQYEVVKRADEDVNMLTEEEEKAVDKEARNIALHKAPPYSWTQDQTDITMQFVLPAGTPKAAISCAFTNQHINLIIRAQDVDISYPYRKLWGTVRADECTWTLEPNTGLFTIFLAKQDEYTRWPYIFDADDGVLETLDKSRLAEIAERLEKFTSANEETGKGPVVQTHQHTVGADIDEDIDQDGQPIRFVVLNKKGELTEQISSGGSEWLCNSFGSSPSVCVKSDVDGQVYAFERKGIIIEPKHVATFDAFAFVQASKRDSRYVRFDPDYQFAIIVESNRNAYIYYRHGDKRPVEKQTLVDLTLGRDVDILGVQLVLDRVVMILTEVEIITLII